MIKTVNFIVERSKLKLDESLRTKSWINPKIYLQEPKNVLKNVAYFSPSNRFQLCLTYVHQYIYKMDGSACLLNVSYSRITIYHACRSHDL